MPNVSETRIAVNLKDGASSGLQHLTNQYSRFSSTIQNTGSRLSQFNRQVAGTNLGGFASNADRAAGSLSNMNKTLERLIYSASRYLVIYKALAGLGNIWDSVVGGSYEYAKSLETNQIGIAGILKSMVTLNGEAIKWNDAMALSGKAMKSLQSEALRTAATSKELIETFRALLGPGLSSGMTIDQIVNLSTVGTNAVRSLGLPTNQYVQELRSIITEGIRPASSTLATSLGITNKDIKEAKKSAEGLYNFLMKRMEGFQDAVKFTSGTVEGRIARIQEGLNVGIAKGAESLYTSYSKVLEKIATALIPVPENLGQKWEINPEFVKNVEIVSTKVGKIASDITDAGIQIAPFFGGALKSGLSVLDQLSDKLGLIIGVYATKRALPIVTDIVNIATQSRQAYEAQTSLGRAIQGVNDKLSGRTAELKRLAAEEANHNAMIDTFLQKMAEKERAYSKELQDIRSIIAEQRRQDREATKMTMASWTRDPKTEAWRAEGLVNFTNKLRELGVEEQRVHAYAQQYFQYIKTGSKEASDSIAQLIYKRIEESSLTQQQLLEQAAMSNARKQGGEVAAQALQQIITKHDNLIKKMQEQGLEVEHLQQEWMTFLNAVKTATGEATLSVIKSKDETRTWADTVHFATDRAGMFLSKIGSLSMSFGILADVLAQADEENKEWYHSAADAALTAGMFAMAIGSIVTELGPLIAKLPAAIRLLREFSIAKAVAGFGGIAAVGIAGAAAAVAGAAVYSGYKQYQAYENNEEVSAIDDFTGEAVTFAKSPMKDIDDADSYAIINGDNVNYGQPAVPVVEQSIGLKYPSAGGVGGGKSRGGSRSNRKAEKKAESEERIKRILEEINRELLTMDDRATAYQKTMADAKVKIAKYEEDVTKAKLRGVDVSKVQSKLDELRLAYVKKATEAQQDENLKRMRQEEESTERYYEMQLNTAEQKRTVLARQLEDHKKYLEDLLREEQMSVDRRMSLEQQLADTVKKIHQNAAYDAKQGWILGLREIANEQTNYKDLTTSLFQTFESGFANLITSGGKVSDFLKEFFQSIIKSLVQVIIKQMISYALMRAMGGGSNVIQTSTGWEQHFSNGTIVSNTPHFVHASGGGVQSGNTYLVGERGPELLRLFGNSGTVYSNSQTKQMMSEPPVVNIEIINNTGSQMKAREENTFDGIRQLKKVILETVSTGAYTNEGGLRDAIQGAAAARG